MWYIHIYFNEHLALNFMTYVLPFKKVIVLIYLFLFFFSVFCASYLPLESFLEYTPISSAHESDVYKYTHLYYTENKNKAK